MEQKLRFATLLVHGGLDVGLEDVFRGQAFGQFYTRIGNPTTEALER